MIFKFLFKLVEWLLRLMGSVELSYFCKAFESSPLPSQVDMPKTLHLFIPFRDRWDLTLKCLNGIKKQVLTGIQCHVHLIDNGSSSSTKQRVQSWFSDAAWEGIILHGHESDEAFNFSKLCNISLTLPQAKNREEYFLFLNNDVVLDNPESLAISTNFASETPNCGAVGITLLFPNRDIQHIFAAPGVKIIASHPFKGRSSTILKDWNKFSRQVPAVTGAFLLISSAIFREVNGFDENLPTAGQDIDLCLKLQKCGYKNWTLPQIMAVHLESASRSRKAIDFDEVDYIYNKWKNFLTQNPAYPDDISRWSEQPVRTRGEGPYPYHRLRSVLGMKPLSQSQ